MSTLKAQQIQYPQRGFFHTRWGRGGGSQRVLGLPAHFIEAASRQESKRKGKK